MIRISCSAGGSVDDGTAFFDATNCTWVGSSPESDGYDLVGDLLGLPLDIRMPEESFDYGIVTASAEISRIFTAADGSSVMPFAELGVNYEFERPDDGQVLAGDLSLETPSPWTFTLRSGARALIYESVQVEVSGGYLSLGQDGLDIWEGKFRVAFGF